MRRSSPWRWARESLGQATVEYALLLVAFMAAILSLGAIWGLARSGALQRAQEEAASHATESADSLGAARDLVLF